MSPLRKGLRCAALAVLVCGGSSAAWAIDPSLKIAQYAHTAWRIQDGAFSGAAMSLTQTEDGALWLGTSGGLLRFDGVRFVPWAPPSGRPMPSPIVRSLRGSRDGSLWIGGDRTLHRLKDGRLQEYQGVSGQVSDIIEDSRGVPWFVQWGTDGEPRPFCHVVSEAVRCYGRGDGVPLIGGTRITEDGQGAVWIGSDTGIGRFRSGAFDFHGMRGLDGNAGQPGILGLAAAPDGTLWVGAAPEGPGRGLQMFKDGVWKPFVTQELDSSTLYVTTLFVDRDGALWVGTNNSGAYRIHDGSVDRVRAADGLSGDRINRFYEDREGNLWISTSKGLDRFRRTRVVSTSFRGLTVDGVTGVLAARDGTVWAGATGALMAIRGDRVSTVTGKDLPGVQVTSLFEDRAGRLWIGIDNRLSIFEGGRFDWIEPPAGRPMGLVMRITEDVAGDIWAETSGPPRTLIRIRDRRIVETLPAPQVPGARVVAADPQGGVWLGLLTGDLARFRDGRTEIIGFGHATATRVNELRVGDDGSVLGATAFGLVGWKSGRKQMLTVRNGLPCDNVHTFLKDHRGALWLYSQCGLVEIERAELQRWWDAPDAVLKVRVLDTFDGVHPGLSPFVAAAQSTDGRLWFTNGLVLQVLDPARMEGNPLPPPVLLEEIVADGVRHAPVDGLRLPPRTRDLRIDYTAFSLAAPQKVRFRYRLEGRDLDWQDPEGRRQAFYNDLAPGAYRFRVVACNNDGVWNENGAAFAFIVEPAWYQTRWFLILCVASVLLSAWALHRLRLRQIAGRIRAQFDERLAERTRIAREFHDTLLQTIQGSKMVADNALAQSGDPIRMERALQQVSGWMARAVDEGRSALHSLRTSTTQTNDLAEALRRSTTQDGLAPNGGPAITFSVVGSARDLHPIVTDEVYHVAHEAIRNARAHSAADRLEVELRYETDLTVRVSDNGVGIDADVARHGRAGHFGLQGMRERAARLGATLTVVSSRGSGTTVTLLVPGSVAYRPADSRQGVAPDEP